MNARRKEGAYTNSFWGKCALPLYWPYPAFARPFLLGTECPNAGKISCDFCVSRPNLGTEGLDILRISLYNNKAAEIPPAAKARGEVSKWSQRERFEIVLSVLRRHVGSNPTFSATKPSLDAVRVQAWLFYFITLLAELVLRLITAGICISLHLYTKMAKHLFYCLLTPD